MYNFIGLLYPNAPISTAGSWLSIIKFAVSNRLTDCATGQLLELIRIHCPPSKLPSSLHVLKNKFMGDTSIQLCSSCMTPLSDNMKMCSNESCHIKSLPLSYFSLLPFENRLQDIFTGKISSLSLAKITRLLIQKIGMLYSTHLLDKVSQD